MELNPDPAVEVIDLASTGGIVEVRTEMRALRKFRDISATKVLTCDHLDNRLKIHRAVQSKVRSSLQMTTYFHS